jgi:hypothetical protein
MRVEDSQERTALYEVKEAAVSSKEQIKQSSTHISHVEKDGVSYKLSPDLNLQQNLQEVLKQLEIARSYPKISQKLIDHLLEASKKGINPIVLAFQKFDLELAETLFKMREQDLAMGKPAFDFPGYEFKRTWKGVSELQIWLKRAPVTYLNNWGGKRYFTSNKVDLSALRLLMKYDREGRWYLVLGDIMLHAYQQCDLEALLFCIPLSRMSPPIANLEVPAARNKIGSSMALPRYLMDPFLSDIPINLENPKHLYIHSHGHPASKNLPSIWDYRPEDNEYIRKLKGELQKLVWWLLIADPKVMAPSIPQNIQEVFDFVDSILKPNA